MPAMRATKEIASCLPTCCLTLSSPPRVSFVAPVQQAWHAGLKAVPGPCAAAQRLEVGASSGDVNWVCV